MKIDANKALLAVLVVLVGAVGWYIRELHSEVRQFRETMMQVQVEHARDVSRLVEAINEIE